MMAILYRSRKIVNTINAIEYSGGTGVKIYQHNKSKVLKSYSSYCYILSAYRPLLAHFRQAENDPKRHRVTAFGSRADEIGGPP